MLLTIPTADAWKRANQELVGTVAQLEAANHTIQLMSQQALLKSLSYNLYP
ncbi:MAG: hypothetical protein ICV83_04800 [Cytophagales bacterium]|nr:hypothetical protein [Cytophagales bacterium]